MGAIWDSLISVGEFQESVPAPKRLIKEILERRVSNSLSVSVTVLFPFLIIISIAGYYPCLCLSVLR